MIAIEKRKLLEQSMEDDSFFLLFGNVPLRRNGDVFYPFRQDSDIILLTGVHSPHIVLLGTKKGGICEWQIFSDPISGHEKLWGTERLSHEHIRAISGIEKIIPMKEVGTYVLTLLQEIVHVYTKRDEENPYFHLLDREDIYVVSPHELLKPLRMIKTEEEILYIGKAISITHMAYEKIRTLIKPKMSEFEIEALIAGTFRSQHTTEAYPTIVASGKNACTLHYTAHTSIIEDGDMVLIDFGAEYHGYASDITRVFPVGETSERQKEVYTSVIAVKDYAESLIRPGVKKSDYELMVREKMNEELQKLGLISEGISRETRETLSRQYFPHSVSHFLGLDVHDIGERDTLFEKGMVITCEPGIYIPLEGIGIRLEDDILITENGRENLSKNISLS